MVIEVAGPMLLPSGGTADVLFNGVMGAEEARRDAAAVGAAAEHV